MDRERTWLVQEDDEVKRLSEEKLRRKLRSNDLSGLEPARPEDEATWRPLHEHALYAEEVPVQGDPAQFARWRLVTGFGWHLAVFLAVTGGIGLAQGQYPFWAAFWGIGLFFHAVKALPAFVQWNHARLGKERRPAFQPESAGSASVREPEVATTSEGARLESVDLTPAREELRTAPVVDGFLVDLEAALEQLDDDLAAPLRGAAQDLHQRRLELEALVGDRRALEQELVATRRRAEDAQGEALTEALEGQVDAIADRLAAMQAAAEVASLLEARERTLLHQVEGLRLAQVQAAAQDQDRLEVGEQARSLRDQLQAAAEVEDELARARRAAASRLSR